MPSFTRPAILLRVEHLALLALAIAVYWERDGNWLLFAILFLAPDLAFAAAVAGSQVGLVAYNLTHAAVAPVILALIGILGDLELAVSLALIWFAHLAFDRAIGYGLKYSLTKNDTHLNRI